MHAFVCFHSYYLHLLFFMGYDLLVFPDVRIKNFFTWYALDELRRCLGTPTEKLIQLCYVPWCRI